MSEPDPVPTPDTGRPRTRQELYDRIRQTSKSQYILEEMVRLGFWGGDKGSPAMSAEWVEKRGELTRELQDLLKKQRRYENRDKALAAMRKKRMAEAKARREETKRKREEERAERARVWREKQGGDIVYLGEGVSAALGSGVPGMPDRVGDAGLPELADMKELAGAMGITVGELRFLAFHRRVSKTTHYKRFYMPKKTGGERLISAPMPRLKSAQHWVLEGILYKLPVHGAAHGFVEGRSIVTNAQQHVGKELVVNWDLKDFFPTVRYGRVKGLFASLGYPEKVATVLGLICTEPDAEEVELDGERFFVHTSARHLPQGAPTSPAITNLICRRFDARLAGIAKQLGFAYTRYADDLSFSASGAAKEHLNKLLWRVRAVVTEEGFHVHPDKLRIMRRGGRQEVTGLIVNEKLGVPREDLRRFRALLHQIERDGPGDKHWRGSGSHMLACIAGYANFVNMVDPEKGEILRARTGDILARHGWQHEIRFPRRPPRDYGVATHSEESGVERPASSAKGVTSIWKRLKGLFRRRS